MEREANEFLVSHGDRAAKIVKLTEHDETDSDSGTYNDTIV
jgi:hypothetical protein